MEVVTIKNINSTIFSIETSIKGLDVSNFKDNKYGSEAEYTYQGLIGGINLLLTDIKTLVKDPEKFVAKSTYSERSNIYNALHGINTYLRSPDNLWSYVENLKTYLRPFHIRFSKGRYIQLENEINEITRKKIELVEIIDSTKKIKEEVILLYDNINEKDNEIAEERNKIDETFSLISQKKSEAEAALKSLDTSIEEVKSKIRFIGEKKDLISESEISVKSNEKIISSFVKEVENTRSHLYSLERSYEDYGTNIKSLNTEHKNVLENYYKEQDTILKEAKVLIENAKKALSYTTAEGLSASFSAQYEAEKEAKPQQWIYGAGISMAFALGIGIWILLDKDAGINAIIGRITLLPLIIACAIFCANMYVKRNNLIQDYAYKMVLAKSIVGFSEQLKNGKSETNDEYTSYMKKVLEEIHQDPLRRRSTSKDNSDEEIGGPITVVNKALDIAEKALGNSK